MNLRATTWQTVGPFFHIGLGPLDCSEIAPPGTPGDRLIIEGRILDGNGEPVPDAVIEIWQANAAGEYAGRFQRTNQREFNGFGRIPTAADGSFRIGTIRPGPVPGPDGIMQAPHLAVRIMMRGLLKSLVTRMYFPGEETSSDPVLSLVPANRRSTLIATPAEGREDVLLWNVELQGESETVFFDC